MVIANFTPDTIHWMHGGKEGKLKPGDIFECPDSTGRHILNKFDKKGVLRMSFNDKVDDKREEAMKTWTRFWERQVIYFNQDNERRKNTQKEYVEPTEELRDHAQRLGFSLIGPWSIVKTDESKVQGLKEENEDLKVKLELLSKQVEALTKAITAREVPEALQTTEEKVALSQGVAGGESEEAGRSAEHKKLIGEFSKLTKERFASWVLENSDRIVSEDYPAAVRAMVREKWERLVDGNFPIVA